MWTFRRCPGWNLKCAVFVLSVLVSVSTSLVTREGVDMEGTTVSVHQVNHTITF